MPATRGSERGIRIAVWQADFTGLDWIKDLVKAGKAIDLLGDGYPNYYTATAENLLPHLDGSLGRAHWQRDPGDIVTSQWAGQTEMDSASIAACRPEEWLQIVAWDES